MIWYVKKQAIHELNEVPKGDKRGLMLKLHRLLEEEKAFTVHEFEHSLTPATKEAFHQLIQNRVFVQVVVR